MWLGGARQASYRRIQFPRGVGVATQGRMMNCMQFTWRIHQNIHFPEIPRAL